LKNSLENDLALVEHLHLPDHLVERPVA